MKRRIAVVLCSALVAFAVHSSAWALPSSNPVVRFDTSLGSFHVELFETQAPATVANFLNYVSADRYQDSFIHRSVPGFVIQGGGYVFPSDAVGLAPVTAFAPIVNESGISNTRGTLAMARTANPNSATSQWFFNLADNGPLLDSLNGGFAVFGKVLGGGMTTVDAIAALQRVNAGVPFNELPVRDFVGGSILKSNLVIVGIQVVPEPGAAALIGIGMLAVWRRRT